MNRFIARQSARLPAPNSRLFGRHGFHCNKKLLFFKTHRDRGMEGTLVVTPGGPD
ncbi:MAG: hypothetical protein PVJ15_00440 [Gammaproteobacteria bacterium]|jgi:hypothetical protein